MVGKLLPGIAGSTQVRIAAIGAAVFALDQILKFLVIARLEPREGVWLLRGVVRLRHARNPSGAFGALSELSEPMRALVFGVVPVAVLGATIWTTRYVEEGHRHALLGVSLVAGGAASNLSDRLTRGTVIDFVSFIVRTKATTFNLADVAIVVGVVLMLKALLTTRGALH